MADVHKSSRSAALKGIRRSFDIYYRDAARTQRMDKLNACFVQPGALVFDIGAHVGDRTGSFLRLGAEVVALEPQPLVFRALRALYGRRRNVTLLAQAAGEVEGDMDLRINTANPTVATVASDFVDAALGAPGWEGQVWDHSVKVNVTTLDALIARHGAPNFIKIDVEGHEPAVLRGLTTPVPCLSFEVTMIHRRSALKCVDLLSALGHYEYNFSTGEAHALEHAPWLDANAMKSWINALADTINSGDVYARQV